MATQNARLLKEFSSAQCDRRRLSLSVDFNILMLVQPQLFETRELELQPPKVLDSHQNLSCGQCSRSRLGCVRISRIWVQCNHYDSIQYKHEEMYVADDEFMPLSPPPFPSLGCTNILFSRLDLVASMDDRIQSQRHVL